MATNEDQTESVGSISRDVGDRLRLARLSRKLSLREAADLVAETHHKLSHNAIARLETGKRQVTVDDLVSLAHAYRVDATVMLSGEQPAMPWSADERRRAAVVGGESLPRPFVGYGHTRTYSPPGVRDLSTMTLDELDRAEAAGERAGLPDGTTPHDLRHHFASILLAAGESVPRVAELLGHADGGALVLSTYGHVIPGGDDRTRRALDEAWSAPDVPRAGETGT